MLNTSNTWDLSTNPGACIRRYVLVIVFKLMLSKSLSQFVHNLIVCNHPNHQYGMRIDMKSTVKD